MLEVWHITKDRLETCLSHMQSCNGPSSFGVDSAVIDARSSTHWIEGLVVGQTLPRWADSGGGSVILLLAVLCW